MSEDGLKPRVVQWNHKRFSLRLEPIYWRALETQAARRSMGLNALVGRLANSPRQGSLASRLRTFCLTQAERQAAEGHISDRQRDLLDLFDHSPTAGAILAENGTVRRVNPSFTRRFAQDGTDFLGQSFLRAFRVQTSIPLSRIWDQFGEGRREPHGGRLAQISRGRVTTATVTLHPISARKPDRFNVVVWVA
ncbi:MAG: ribbon-helix-helix domain-containing protein [Pseudomonadota bacterium]